MWDKAAVHIPQVICDNDSDNTTLGNSESSVP